MPYGGSAPGRVGTIIYILLIKSYTKDSQLTTSHPKKKLFMLMLTLQRDEIYIQVDPQA
jgi:hypothetical protein